MLQLEGLWDVVLFLARERKCDPLVSDSKGRTTLHHFTGAGKLEIVKQIVDELQANPSTPDNEGNVPLHAASEKGNLDIVKYLVEEKQCDPMIRKKTANTSLNFVALNGHLNILQYFVRERHCNPTEGGWRGKTPLHDASQEGHLNIVRYLVEEEGVDPSCTDAENSTPLHSASYSGHLQVVQYLIQKHCNPMQEDKDGNTPLKEAASRKQWGVVMYFVKVYCSDEGHQGVKMFHQACSDGRLDVMNCLVQNLQVDPSIPNDDGITPLHIASSKGHLSMVKYLVECSCSPLCKEKNGNTPMNYAALGGHLNVLQYYITIKNYSPTTKGWHSRTVLHDASQEGHLHVVKYLADLQSVDPLCKDDNGLTPLHAACKGGHMGVVKYLVSQKYCDPSISQPQVPSPIELAFVSGNIEIAVYLLGKCTVAPNSNELLKAVLKLFPVLSPSVKVYIIGYRSSGKSTLTKALQDEDSQFTGRFLNVSGVTAGTAGIDPVQFNSKRCGKITLYDFAGHKEYYGSHEALFESTSHPVFLIAIDLRSPDEEILKTLKYWISLASKGVSCARSQADIILVGSHADVLKARELQTKCDLLTEFVRSSQLSFENVECVGWANLDCRKSASDGMTKLRQLLEQSCRLARFRADYNNTNAVLLLRFLTQRYIGRRNACTFSTLFDALLHEEIEVYNTLKHPLRLCEACESLNTSGDIVFLKSQENMEDSWIILEKEHILSDVQGILKTIKSLTSTGLVTWSILRTKTSEPSLVVEYMLKMEFCSEIDRHSFKQIKGAVEPKKGERYFFFPDLTMEKRPQDVWQHYDQLTYSFGWILKCSQTDCTNFFTPRFLQVLLVRLTCRFALTPRPDSLTGVVDPSPGCRIWMNGISWKDTMLMVEVLVEVTQQNTAVVVLLKCMQQETTEEMEFFKLRSSLIEEVRSIKNKHCSTLKTTESLIPTDHIQQYPLQAFPELPISTIANAIANKHRGIIHPESRNLLLLKELLLFDPFENFGIDLLQLLSSSYQESREVKVPENVLHKISIAAVEAWQKLAVILEVGPDIISKVQIDPSKTEIEKCRSILDHWSSSRKNTYSDLCKQLSSYSIFSGMVWI